MKFSLAPCFLLFFSICCYCQERTPLEKYLDEVFKIIEAHSLKRDSTDFKKIKASAYSKLDNAQSIEDCYPIVRSILVDLNDHHSIFMNKDAVKSWRSTSKTKTIFDDDLQRFSGKLLNQDIGYVSMQGFTSGDSTSIIKYANDLQALIKSIDHKNIKGWILDLRYNTGGNCWPMLTGLGPLLGNGICGYFINSNGKKSAWYYKNGIAGVNSSKHTKVSNEPYTLLKEKNPIAVLTGPYTASSGEVIVTSFRKKENAKSFGESTAGLSTGNSDFTLSDGSIIFLTTSVYADRKGNIYGGKIVPDSVVTFSYEEMNTENDQVIMSALKWIYKN